MNLEPNPSSGLPVTASADAVFSLIYNSSALPGLGTNVYREIAHQAVEKNKRLNITGLLLIHNGLILQVLEGPKASVEAVFDSICQDDRHRFPRRLCSQLMPRRDFGDWSMGFQAISGEDRISHMFDLNQASLAQRTPEELSGLPRAFLRSFVRSSSLSR